MSVYKNKLKAGVSWFYQFSVGARDSKKTYKQGGFATKAGATKAEAERRIALASAPPEPVQDPKSLKAVIAEYLADSKHLEAKTLLRYEELAGYLLPELVNKPIGDITPLDLHREWQRLVETGGRNDGPLSTKTVWTVSNVVSGAYRWAMLYEICQNNPVSVSKRPRREKHQSQVFTLEQTELLIGTAPDPLNVFLETCAGLGARRGEVLALRWADIAGGYVNITRSLGQVKQRLFWKDTKTGAEGHRCIEVPARTMRALEGHRRQQEQYRSQPGYRLDLDLVFCEPDGNPLKPDKVSQRITKLCQLLKFPKGASLHTLRHSHGSQLLTDGVPIAEVSKRLGHKSPHTTLEIYSHAIPDRSRAAEVWDRLQEKHEEKENTQ